MTKRITSIDEHDHDRIAVVADRTQLCYGDLERRANQLAGLLISKGVGRGSLVALYLGRTVDAIISMVGVMKSGAAYTFIDNDGNPVEKRSRLEAIGADMVITTVDDAAFLAEQGFDTIHVGEAEGHAFDRRRLPEIRDDDTAYVLFTSGSTGIPKGVVITHGNVNHYTTSLIDRLGVSRPLSYAHVSTLSADLGNTCLFLSLWTGGTLHIIDNATRRDPAAMLHYLATNEIDFLKITPSHWGAIFNTAAQSRAPKPSFQYLLLGGEMFPRQLAHEIFDAGITQVLANHYGPTETTVGVTINVLRDRSALDGLNSKSIPIGTPFGRTRAVVRTDDNTFAYKGARGELYIGGPSVAKGYLGNEAATAASFVTDVDGAMRFYKTGDFVSINEYGVIEFLGRIDRQVKINGYRVELDHIANVLRQLDEVDDATTYYLEMGGRRQLVAALLIADGTAVPSDSAIKARLQEMLPGYMIPSRFLPCGEFPLNGNGKTDIGKLQAHVEVRLQKAAEQVAGRRAPAQAYDDPLIKELYTTWRDHLDHADFEVDDSFFDVGGDSVAAIQVISDLQVKGYQISANTFLKEPTIKALAAHLSRLKTQNKATIQVKPRKLGSERFASSQSWFLEQRFEHPEYWNQAILLQSESDISAVVMAGVVQTLLELHPMLRTAYRKWQGRWQAKEILHGGDACFSISAMGEADEQQIADHIQSTAQSLHGSIDLERGRVFKVHLFKLDQRPDQLLLISHHMSIDAVSWRIIIDDLVRLYSARIAGIDLHIPPNRNTFWDWVDHINDHAQKLSEHAEYWRTMLSQPLSDGEPSRAHGDNREGNARTVWLSFSLEESQKLIGELSAKLGSHISMVLLGAFAHALTRQRQRDSLLVDIESHGRACFADDLEISRVTGWFTSMFPVVLNADAADPTETIRAVDATVSDVPDLGIPYNLVREELASELPHPSPQICYNYLGDFHIRYDESLVLGLSRYPIGPARGASNDRVHDLKITARTVDHHLVVDLSFSADRYEDAYLVSLLQETRRILLDLVDMVPNANERVLVEAGTSTGLVAHVPEALELEPPAPPSKDYDNILLTGATGYIGVYVLRELLHQTSARVHCLIRDKDKQAPESRLAEVYSWYFPNESLQDYAGRYTVIRGDVGQEHFGLAADMYERLCSEIDAIYHFAADIRLFGGNQGFEKQNIDSVKTAIQIASLQKPKALHYMSTLAVCGINSKPKPVVFSEHCLDIGQEFQNEYEKSKYKAEKLVLEFIASGGAGFIYRSGNVSGHSRSGRFQRNARDNRFVQFLSAVVKLGRLPKTVPDSIVLSPVDTVAAGIVALSVSPETRGGTFHVDHNMEIPLANIFDKLAMLGVELERTSVEDFATLFQRYANVQDRDVAVGRFWALRKPRNVRYDHSKTHVLLARHDCHFRALDQVWVGQFLRNLVNADAFQVTNTSRRSA